MITVRVPLVLDAAVLRVIVEAAAMNDSAIRLETFYRIENGDGLTVDCDTENEVKQYAIALAKNSLKPGSRRDGETG